MAEARDRDEALLRELRALQIDPDMTFRLLDGYNRGAQSVRARRSRIEIPAIDGKRIVDLQGDISWRVPKERAERALSHYGLSFELIDGTPRSDAEIVFDRGRLETIGKRLYPVTAYGVLNGGSATSYTDETKNRAFNADLLALCRPAFDAMGARSRGRPKGLTPAFVQPDGSPGPSYLELKLRALLVAAYQSGARPGAGMPAPLAPAFQMTSVTNDEDIRAAVGEYRDSPLLRELIEATGIDITEMLSRPQPLVGAFTHSQEGAPKRLFRTNAPGDSGQLLPLPGGHGQNFAVLRPVYEELRTQGKRFIQLCNIDNLGSVVDPAELALLALSGRPAGFDFSFRTPVDVKGGILVRREDGTIDCADIGPAVSAEEVAAAESRGTRVLFNCASGLFDLDYLTGHLDTIIDELPVRWSDQVKDVGRYSQAEQVTWEVMGMMDDCMIFAVDKYRRFLAAKLLLENLMTSGIAIDDPAYPTDPDPARDLKSLARRLHAGLEALLAGPYAMRTAGNRWAPIPVGDLAPER